MDVFALRNALIANYAPYIQGFIRIRATIERELQEGLLWPDPLVQISPSFEPGGWIEDLVGACSGRARGKRMRVSLPISLEPSRRKLR